MESNLVIKYGGYLCWEDENGLPHREGGPAQIQPNGDKFWFYHNQKHREDGPAVEYANGMRLWYYEGKQHRVDGPAIIYPDGTLIWMLDNKYHREGGPAYESPFVKVWYRHGVVHREDGPAVESTIDGNHYFFDGKEYSSQEKLEQIVRLKAYL